MTRKHLLTVGILALSIFSGPGARSVAAAEVNLLNPVTAQLYNTAISNALYATSLGTLYKVNLERLSIDNRLTVRGQANHSFKVETPYSVLGRKIKFDVNVRVRWTTHYLNTITTDVKIDVGKLKGVYNTKAARDWVFNRVLSPVRREVVGTVKSWMADRRRVQDFRRRAPKPPGPRSYVRLGRSYQGFWGHGESVTYKIDGQKNGVRVYYGEMLFHRNKVRERCTIRYRKDGQIQVIRHLGRTAGKYQGQTQWFIAGPIQRRTRNGRVYDEFRGQLVGAGVGGAANEVGALWVFK